MSRRAGFREDGTLAKIHGRPGRLRESVCVSNMENMTAEPQTRTIPVVNHLPVAPSREVAVRFESSVFVGTHNTYTACIYTDEIETLSFSELMQVVMLRAHTSAEETRTGLVPLMDLRLYASTEGTAALTRMAKEVFPPSE